MKRAVLLLVLLGGCSNTAWQLGAGQPHLNSNVQVHGSGGLAAALGITILAAGAYEMARSGVFLGSNNAQPPEMAPDRKVSEQDCSKPIDFTLGNIRCK